MPLPLVALGAIGAAYLDAKHLIRKDLKTAATLIWRSFGPKVLERRGVSLFMYFLESHVKSRPNDVALIYPEQISFDYPEDPMASLDHLFKVHRYTWAELYDKVLKVAHVLKHKYGIQAGDFVAMDCMNSDRFVFLIFALWSLGATPALINYNLVGESLVHCVKISSAKYIFVDPAVADNVKTAEDELVANGHTIVYADDAFYGLADSSPQFRAPDAERNDNHKLLNTGALIYTSGTTGWPKSANVSWRKLIIGPGAYAAAMRINKNTCVYSPMPLYHSTATVLGMMSAFVNGGAFVTGRKFSARTFWTQAKLGGATYAQYVGETCRYLLNTPPGPDDKTHGVQVVIGNGMRADIWSEFKERFNIPVVGEFYGATEFPTAVTNFQQGEYGKGALSSYGTMLKKLLFATQYRIAVIDPNDTEQLWRDPETGFCRNAKPGEPGEFLFKIPDPSNIQATFQGYHGNKEASDKKIAWDVFKKGDAYVRSGDLIKLDEAGLMYFVDRMGDTFRWKSENVATNEVEEAITGVPGVQQVVVVGVKVPNHEGRAGFAVIEPTDFEKLPDTHEIAKAAIAKLPKYAVPVFIKFTQSRLEATGNNKVQKAKYRNQKIPSEEETIYWLKGDTYVPLTNEDWARLNAGNSKL
ncbi:very long-chain fatty acid transport protein [Trichomonascus vanleenenianus]|uniref:very long-chain fatty acid transport protein n=1 Tax=Trichomonascus vanleenenianus TaxID=2268995 RepID=UPI003ECABB88